MRLQDESLCDAIRQKKTVEMLYDDDVEYHLFAPTALYYDSPSRDRILVDGLLIDNPTVSWERNQLRTYKLKKVKKVKLTALPFSVKYVFSSPDDGYEHGVIRCHRQALRSIGEEKKRPATGEGRGWQA